MNINIDIGVTLKGEYLPPTFTTASEDSLKVAVCLHPWSWLGGSMHDPVLDILARPFHDNGYHVFRYNSRGVGGSSGWPTLTGLTEGKDLEAVVDWSLRYVQGLGSPTTNDSAKTSDVVIVGYSHGSLIASLYPILPGKHTKVSHVLVSYPLGPRKYLTLFHSSTYASKLRELVQNRHSNVLIIYGDQDEFTSAKSYEGWAQELIKQGQKQNRMTVCCRPGASHFWRGRHGIWLAETVAKWL
ncbi:Alpha/Beta hydrolase protein [Lentinula raphanica]|uniref:Alpha/Beta hydrolase protein n=1 Tax=Lentinula raphanica TaxID=153919 RepID=A0AA38P088_9AGAR|nr:Alpha/Beta hydrolase protein [Lentinula raphanica]KAJ3977990.1 Alpha/Beta hydrolase protein [Lentinula raphanica]